MEYAIVLLAALAHAIWNGLVKNSEDKLLSLTFVRFIGMILGLSVIATQPSMDMSILPYVLLASSIHFVYFYCLINTYKLGDFSQVYPISRGLAPMLVLFVGLFVLQDNLTRWQVIGTILICAGLMYLAMSKRTISLAPFIFAVATAFCIAGYTLVSGVGVRLSESFLVYAGWLEVVTGTGVLIFSFIRRGKETVVYGIRNWKHGSLTGILSIGGYSAALWAMTKLPISSVAVLRETSIIFAALIGGFVLKEKFAFSRIFASTIVVTGIACLVLNGNIM
jgi:drug/metabolite transporter (DMT)-like permease